MAPSERRFPIMGCTGHVIVDGGQEQMEIVTSRLRDLEERWSRFIDSSDLSRMNSSPGELVGVHPDTITLIHTMIAAHDLSSGAFDPSVLPALVASGYESSRHDSKATTVLAPGPYRSSGALRDVIVDPLNMTVQVPQGVALDPGGVGKGLAADLVVRELSNRGVESAMVNIGGDLAVLGCAPHGGPWVVSIEDPFSDGRSLGAFGVAHGGVATSSKLSRRWMHQGRQRHHIIDPRTALPAETTVAQVTVIAITAWRAEAIACEVMIAGFDRAVDVLLRAQCSGVVVDDSGIVKITPDMVEAWASACA